MGDGITISGGGSTAVATDELFASAQQLHRLALEAASLRIELGGIDRLISLWGLQRLKAPVSAARAESDIDQAKIVMAEVEAESRAIGWALSSAAEAYGFIERFIAGVGFQLSSDGAAIAGTVLSASAAASPLVVGAARMMLRDAVSAHLFSQPAGPSGSHELNEIVTNPITAGAVRNASMSMDDGILAASGMPYPIAQLLGDNGLGLTGLGFSSAALMGAGASVGLFTETPVRATAEKSTTVDGPPTTFSERLGRVPDPEADGGAQVVVEKYTMPGQPDRFEVYVAGTVTFSPEATTEPWDMTSNMSNAAGDGGGSLAAVEDAMRKAGVQDSSQVQLTGYSQGGGTVARLAASGDFNVVGLTTFGGPTGQIPIPADIPTVIVEHTDDIVPALGGYQANQQALIVERDVFAGREIPDTYAVPAHHIEYYEETAALMDAASSDQVTSAASRLASFGAGATSVTSTAYTYERVDPSAVDGGGR